MGLKTGCAIESRQLESRHGIENFLSLASAQVWQMLWLRHQARAETPAPAAAILSDGQIEALTSLCAALPAKADAQQTLIAIAKLGGYFGRKSDGPPGWRTIWKGFQYLTTYAEGFEAARNALKTTLRATS
ncbi:MAG: Transposase [Myxococcaceae bacterium]|nr:Transposase [Myxococcaceae bacterium]